MPVIQHCSSDYALLLKRGPHLKSCLALRVAEAQEGIHSTELTESGPPTAGDNLTFEGGWEERDQPSLFCLICSWLCSYTENDK